MAKTLLEVLEESEIELTSSGNRRVASCPFHKGDRDPSFTVYPNQTYYCFGCHVWGDALKFLVDYKEMTFYEAMEHLGADYRQPKEEKPKVIKVRNTQRMYKFLYSVMEQYHNFLLETPGALEYLKSRGLTMDTITKYKLGYTDGRVLNLHWAWEHELALEAGLINRNGFELLSHRIVFPNLLDQGHCDFAIGRTVTNDRIKYLALRVPKPLFGFYESRKSPILFVVEGQMDWLVLRQWGYPAVAITGGQVTGANYLLLDGKRLIIVPDLDEAGQGIATATKIKNHIGESAFILDYSELQSTSEKLDVAKLAESSGGQNLFRIIVNEQCPWLTINFSTRQLNQFLPNLTDSTPLDLTQKPLASTH